MDNSFKQRISILLDHKVLDYYKGNFDKYQTAINDYLLKSINQPSIDSIVQDIYGSLKKIRKDKFKEFTALIYKATKNIDLKINFTEVSKLIATLKFISPEFIIDIEELSKNHVKRDDFSEIIKLIYFTRKIGLIISTEHSQPTRDDTALIALALSFLEISFDSYTNYIEDNCYIITNNEDLLHEYIEWDEANEKNNQLLALCSLNQSSEKVTPDYQEHICKIKCIDSIYQYHLKVKKDKVKLDINKAYGEMLSVIYTNIAYASQNFGNFDLDDIPDFLIFTFIISDFIKISNSKELREHNDIEEMPIHIFSDNGFIWDINVFEIPTTCEPVLGLDEFGHFIKDMNYVEAYRPHLQEILDSSSDTNTKESINAIFEIDDFENGK